MPLEGAPQPWTTTDSARQQEQNFVSNLYKDLNTFSQSQNPDAGKVSAGLTDLIADPRLQALFNDINSGNLIDSGAKQGNDGQGDNGLTAGSLVTTGPKADARQAEQAIFDFYSKTG